MKGAILRFSFNPLKVTANQIVMANRPAGIMLDGSEFVVQPIKFGLVNIYLIKTSQGYILVDTGMPKSEEGLDTALKNSAIDPKTINLIILTHGHLDHVGCISYAKRITNAKMLVHKSFAEQLERGEIEPAIARNSTTRFLNYLTSLLETGFEGVTPDILVEDEYDLAEFGISGKVIHTPGHSSSSISIILDNGETLLGDMAREEKSGVVTIGHFFEDEKTLLESLKKVTAFKPSIIYLSHGNHIDNLALRALINTLV